MVLISGFTNSAVAVIFLLFFFMTLLVFLPVLGVVRSIPAFRRFLDRSRREKPAVFYLALLFLFLLSGLLLWGTLSYLNS